MGGLITHQKFLKYQGIFFLKCSNSDMPIQLGITTAATPSGDFLKDFTGSNTRTTEWYDFNALYNTNIDTYERDRYGLSKTESGLIYLSPLQLEPVFGTFILDRKTTMFRKWNGSEWHEFMLDKIEYFEPLYNSCIAVEFSLKEQIRG